MDLPVRHNNKAQWLKKAEKNEYMKKQLQKLKSWRASGPDGLQGYWIKAFISYHERIAVWLQLCL